MTKLGWDSVSGQAMRLRGVVQFSPHAAGLMWEEHGMMALGNYRGEASRRYVLCFRSVDVAEIRFGNGTPFHDLDLKTGLACVSHDCAPDSYTGRYRALGPDRWVVSWRVVGPRKRQLITSHFDRRP